MNRQYEYLETPIAGGDGRERGAQLQQRRTELDRLAGSGYVLICTVTVPTPAGMAMIDTLGRSDGWGDVS